MKVSGLGRFALGQSVPNREHAVCVSLPTIRDLVGYEEKDNRVRSSIRSGYPRFVQHYRIGELIRFLDLKEGTEGRRRFLFADAQTCKEAGEVFSITDATIEETEEFTSLLIPDGSPNIDFIASFLQHSGSGISSRMAEDILLRAGQLEHRETISQVESPGDTIRNIIAKAHGPEISREDVLLGSSGANVFYSLFRSACEHSRGKGKDLWIRMGWLYLDTIEVMDLLTNEDERVIPLNRLEDFARIEELFKEHGERIAGVVTEFPTNPLCKLATWKKSRNCVPKRMLFSSRTRPWHRQKRQGIRTCRRRRQQLDQIRRVRRRRHDGKFGLSEKVIVGKRIVGTNDWSNLPTLREGPSSNGRTDPTVRQLYRDHQSIVDQNR